MNGVTTSFTSFQYEWPKRLDVPKCLSEKMTEMSQQKKQYTGQNI